MSRDVVWCWPTWTLSCNVFLGWAMSTCEFHWIFVAWRRHTSIPCMKRFAVRTRRYVACRLGSGVTTIHRTSPLRLFEGLYSLLKLVVVNESFIHHCDPRHWGMEPISQRFALSLAECCAPKGWLSGSIPWCSASSSQNFVGGSPLLGNNLAAISRWIPRGYPHLPVSSTSGWAPLVPSCKR